jgi:opacity protein-like surface antigen
VGTLKTNSSLRFAALAAIGVGACAGAAQATDLAPYVPPAPGETWTGFSLGVGGGVAFLDADVNARASRRDEVGECRTVAIPSDNPEDFIDLPCDPEDPFPITTLLSVDQITRAHIDDLDDTGGFITVQGAYDYQFAPRWVAGVFVDADWSDLSAHARETHTSSPPPAPPVQDVAFLFGVGEQKTTVGTQLSTDWSISVGGRIGWLAAPRTLLYFLAAYTHQDLSDARVRVSIADPIQSLDLGGQLSADGFGNSPTNLLVKLPDSLDGFSLGGGGEVKLGGPWALKGEYRWTHLEGGSGRASSSTFQSIPTSLGCNIITGLCDAAADFRDTRSQASADFDLDIHTVRAVLTYHFWTGRGYGG